MISKKIKLGLAMLKLKGFGKAKVSEVISSMQQIPTDAEKVFDAINNFSSLSSRKFPEVTKKNLEIAMDRAVRIMESCSVKGINIDYIASDDDRSWVRRYAGIPSAPLLLFSLGNTSVLDMPTIAIIGTREPTATGLKFASSIARKSIESGFCVISGLAIGCDIEAHKSTLEHNGKTVAILAHGLNEVHPIQHTEIANQIIDKGGCLLSEYPPNTPIERGYFVERDRLQSAVSLGVMVIETSLNGGSMHTVHFAEKQNRQVACLDHPDKFHDLTSIKGNRKLIDKGVTPIWDEASIDNFLEDLKQNSKSLDTVEPKQKTLL